MERLYFLIPDKDTTTKIVHELSEMGLSKDELHVMGKDWRPLEKEEGVPRATLIQTSDVVNASRRGAIAGGILGIVLGLIIHFILDGTRMVWMVLGMGVFGALFGVWTSTMVGVSVRDIKVAKFDKAIKRGEMLLMADVPAEHEEDFRRAIRHHHPDVVIDRVRPKDEQAHKGKGH